MLNIEKLYRMLKCTSINSSQVRFFYIRELQFSTEQRLSKKFKKQPQSMGIGYRDTGGLTSNEKFI